MSSGGGLTLPGELMEKNQPDPGGGMPEAKRQNERLIVLPIFGVLILNYPLLSLFNRAQLLFGVPVLYLGLFLVWFIYIVCVAIVMETSPQPPELPESPKSKKTM